MAATFQTDGAVRGLLKELLLVWGGFFLFVCCWVVFEEDGWRDMLVLCVRRIDGAFVFEVEDQL